MNVKVGKIYEITPVDNARDRMVGKTFMVRVVGETEWKNYPCVGTTVLILEVGTSWYKGLFNNGLVGQFYINADRFLLLKE